VRLEQAELVEQLGTLLDALTNPKLYGLMGKAATATTAPRDPGATDASL
jgi:hypothetical protein